MDPLTIALFTATATKAVGALMDIAVSEGQKSIVGGILGNRADAAVCLAYQAAKPFLKQLRSTDPALNHDLEHATREAYLLATAELIRQAQTRLHLSTAATQFRTAGQDEALANLLRGIELDLDNVQSSFPRSLPNAELLLLDPQTAPALRLQNLRDTLRQNLAADTARWLPVHPLPSVVEDLLQTGWILDTAYLKNVPRDWYSLIALAFVEKLKTDTRLARVFETRLLAQIAAREREAAPLATFAGFTAQLDRLAAPLQRFEDSLDILRLDVHEIKTDVKEIKAGLRQRTLPRWAPALIATLLFITLGAVGSRTACQVPGIHGVCRQFGWGGVPTIAETQFWNSRPPGSCVVLRTYLTRFPQGGYAREATVRLAALTTGIKVNWTPTEKSFPAYTSLANFHPRPTEPAAHADALRQAQTDINQLCQSYNTGLFRLRHASVSPSQWNCQKLGTGYRCAFQGVAKCSVEQRQEETFDQCP